MANTLEFLQGGSINEQVAERILVYGRAGVGKTRFGLSLTPRFGKIAYFAADKNSWLLQSIDRKKRDRVLVVKPKGEDPTALFMQFCMTDWAEVDPEINTLVVDTYTKVAMDAIAYTANTNAVDRERHYIVGEVGKGGVAIPNRGDYQAIDSLSKGFLDMLFDKQDKMNIVFLCHEDSKQVEGMTAMGGPSHPGRQMIDYLPAQFSTVVRLIRADGEFDPEKGELESKVVAISENDGKYVAKMRLEDEEAENPMARVVLNRNPVNWWEQYDALHGFTDEPKPKKTTTNKRGK